MTVLKFLLSVGVIAAVYAFGNDDAKKTAGVWPDRFDANMTATGSQPMDPQLTVNTLARLRYDFPGRRQRWDYAYINGTDAGYETWINTTLYYVDPTETECYPYDVGLYVLKPEWLTATNYLTTQYLRRQPPVPSDIARIAVLEPNNYTLSDLYQLEAPLGMTNSWVVADSPIGEPTRLEGPQDFDNPDYVSILEFTTFVPQEIFDETVFQLPDACNTQETQKRVSSAMPSGARSPALFFNQRIRGM